MDLNIFVIRLVICLLLSIVIGLERQYRHGSVGLRTYVLVSIGAFLFNSATYSYTGHDASRIASSIVSGIGFLGAGMIIKDGKSIRGLNTAATLWCVAAIGLLTSTGMLWESIIGTIFVLISNIILRVIALLIMKRVELNYKEICKINIVCEPNVEVIVRSSFSKYIEKQELKLSSLEKKNNPNGDVKLNATIETSRIELIQKLVQNISAEPGVLSISWDHKNYHDVLEEDYSDD